MEKASHKANVQCAEDIGKAINSHFDGFHYHTGFEKELIETYGMERVKYVVAYNIQQKLNDGRISKENKTWALQSQMNQGEDNPNRNIRSIPIAACWIYLLTVFENNSSIMKQKKA